MDFAILLLTGRMMKLTYRLYRLLLGSAVGAAGACILLMARHLPSILEMIFAYGILTVTMVLISFGKYQRNRLVKISLTLFGLSIFLGGIIQFLLMFPLVKEFIYSILNVGTNSGFSFFSIAPIVLILLLLSPYVFRYINDYKRKLLTVFKVTLSLEGNVVETKGLLDTGNHLREPISNKPVIIVEQKVMDEIMTKKMIEYDTRVKIVPYRSIGKDSGTMCGLVLDELVVDTNEGQHIYKNVIACFYTGTLSSKEEYQVILHEELM